MVKIIIKGRNPMMRHVSKTHRVALPKIKIKYVDTKNQLADLLTKGNFTRDEWNHPLRLFNIMTFSVFSCSHFPSNRECSIMSKNAQERGTKEEPAVAKPRPACLLSRNPLSARQTSSLDSGASYVPGKQELDHRICLQHKDTLCEMESATQQ